MDFYLSGTGSPKKPFFYGMSWPQCFITAMKQQSMYFWTWQCLKLVESIDPSLKAAQVLGIWDRVTGDQKVLCSTHTRPLSEHALLQRTLKSDPLCRERTTTLPSLMTSSASDHPIISVTVVCFFPIIVAELIACQQDQHKINQKVEWEKETIKAER